MKCNGCGRQMDVLGGIFAYGSIECESPQTTDGVWADHRKTLCPRCQHVMFDILKNSDLKEQWDNYDWSLKGGPYTEPYDD